MVATEQGKKKEGKVSIRIRKAMKNPLLKRKQFAVELIHPGRQSLSKADLRAKISQMFKVENLDTIFLTGFQTAFGGGRSSGFCLIYDTIQDAKRFEPKHRLVRIGLAKKEKKGRKQIKERKNRAKKARGKEKVKILYKTAEKK